MIDYDKVQDSIIDSLVSDSSKWLEDEKKEVYSNERVAGNTIAWHHAKDKMNSAENLKE